MKLSIYRYPEMQREDVTGSRARAELKSALTKIGQCIMMPEPPYTGIVRRRALERLRAGDRVWTSVDRNGQPNGDVIVMPQKIVGIIKEDGTYEEVGEGAGNP